MIYFEHGKRYDITSQTKRRAKRVYSECRGYHQFRSFGLLLENSIRRGEKNT